MPETWLHCNCGEPMYKFIGDELPTVGEQTRSKDYEGAKPGEWFKPCPECGATNYLKIRNLHGLENA